ncbi:hypothetical protein AI2760V1_4804 (plasmid) [Enterobacter cloacae]|nr:hypothetical protein AI2760V1_4804 [Enterobacter cloacae]CAH4024056.1 hypothetical protein AI2760V1_4804 [Enterobacter cloacae]
MVNQKVIPVCKLNRTKRHNTCNNTCNIFSWQDKQEQ